MNLTNHVSWWTLSIPRTAVLKKKTFVHLNTRRVLRIVLEWVIHMFHSDFWGYSRTLHKTESKASIKQKIALEI